ncbi:bifunctional UDP-sugar hydrolase/5'-nucleotidase [Brachyspira sp. G79]|uniref:bifunctional metallophosphatase/5'-nucleotidase n=1 Tax=Brachyspira sp. G79 TaxID=1358104 RepID=UPI000BBC566E|nr:bifunctional UDP-sugar hydrolase/5'-nucleotidase [Brachyspira sp. G79]PCG20184.1 5'-nucleotidase [Brachyspira sp. G79]
MKKQFQFAFILTVIILFSFSCSSSKKTGNNGNLTIIHMNDTHGKDEEEKVVNKEVNPPETNYMYGAARRAAYIKQVKSTNNNVLVLHAGDTITGSVYSTVFQGRDEVDIMNMIGVDAVTIGNHFVDYGLDNFTEIMKDRKFPTLSINIKNKTDNSYYALPYMVTNVNGLNVAIIGVTTTEPVYSSSSVKDLVFEEEIKALKDFLKKTPINTTNDVTILLSHIGYEMDKKVAEAIPNTFDIIIGGHSHTELHEADVVNGTPIVQTGCYGKYLGDINLSVSNGTINNFDYKLVLMDQNIEQDKDMLAFIDEMKGTVDKEFNVRIGTLPVELPQDGIRTNSMAIGNFACDLVLDSYDNIDIAIVNSGALRTSLPSGDITLGKIQNEFFPFNNQAVTLSLNGKDLIDMIKISAKKRGGGGFLQYSRGIEIVYSAEGELISAKLNGEDITENKDYNIVMSDYILDGGDGYIDSENNPIGRKGKNIIMTGNDIRDALISQIKKLNNIPTDYIDEKPRVIFE